MDRWRIIKAIEICIKSGCLADALTLLTLLEELEKQIDDVTKQNGSEKMMDKIKAIMDLMPLDERLVCLAEEAAELSQAALKYRRTIIKHNPTPVDSETAYDMLLEEIADVRLCLMTLYTNNMVIQDIMDQKLDRWIQRLEGQDNE
jgi:NTP pyrophosphatase (non-canonical NTP hydrolase)